MPSVISATTAVAVANSVMSGNLVPLSKHVSPTECSAEESEYQAIKASIKTEHGVDDDDDEEVDEEEDEDELSSDEMCLEAKEVVQYTSSESSSEDDNIREDGEDSDYGGGRGERMLVIFSLLDFVFNPFTPIKVSS